MTRPYGTAPVTLADGRMAYERNAATVVVKCARCKGPFTARVADRNRGWGKFCSKSCKAIKQTQRTGYAGPSHSDDLIVRLGYRSDDWAGFEEAF